MRRQRAGVILVLAALVLWLRIFRHNRDLLLRHGRFRWLLKRYNDTTRKFSGTRRSTLGLLTHTGRRSGRSYQTSLGACGYGDGFLLPLTYGPRTDWCRNLMAAGVGTLAWKGRTYDLERPEIVSGPEPMQAWPIGSRIMFQLTGIHDFVWLHQANRS